MYHLCVHLHNMHGLVVVLPLIVEWRSWMTSFVHVVTFFLGFVHCPWTSEQHSKQPQKHQQQDGLKHLKLTLRHATMWVIRIEDVLALAGPPPSHEELQRQRLLVSWPNLLQQWPNLLHPFRVVQRCTRFHNLCADQSRVNLQWAELRCKILGAHPGNTLKQKSPWFWQTNSALTAAFRARSCKIELVQSPVYRQDKTKWINDWAAKAARLLI